MTLTGVLLKHNVVLQIMCSLHDLENVRLYGSLFSRKTLELIAILQQINITGFIFISQFRKIYFTMNTSSL